MQDSRKNSNRITINASKGKEAGVEIVIWAPPQACAYAEMYSYSSDLALGTASSLSIYATIKV